jgi:hypothetical protein
MMMASSAFVGAELPGHVACRSRLGQAVDTVERLSVEDHAYQDRVDRLAAWIGVRRLG